MTAEIMGADQLAKISRQLKELGQHDLEKELQRGIREAMEPIKRDMQTSIDQNLPQHGGFAHKVRREVKFRINRRHMGVRLTASHRYMLRLIDKGMARHPLFGNRHFWYTTSFEPGALSGPFERNVDQARHKISDAGQHALNKIGR